MSGTPAGLEPLSGSRGQSLLAPHRLILLVMWVVATGTTSVLLIRDVRSTHAYETARYVLQAGYVGALLWYLGRTGPPANQLPELQPQVLPRWSFSAWIPVLGIALLFALTVVADSGFVTLMLLMIVASVWILVAWRREIRWRFIAQGLAVALVAYLAGMQMAHHGFVSRQVLNVFLPLSFPMYVAGGLLLERTRLGGGQLLTARYGQALKSLLWGVVLFTPLGLINATGGSPGPGITWVTEWWMPLWLSWSSALAEETWFRLFLVGLCFFLLRPALPTRPALAVIAAVLFSGSTFGLGHDRTLVTFLVTGLLYGVPFAAVFARRDWEHAVGAHYMVNFVPWVMAFLAT